MSSKVELYVIPRNDHELCSDYDEDCHDILAEGYTLECWRYNKSTGICPFVGN